MRCLQGPVQRTGGDSCIGTSGFLLMDTLLDFVFDFSRASIEEIAAGREDQALRFAGESGGPASLNGHKRKSFR